jgi:integrase
MVRASYPEYSDAMMVLALTGLRPAELVLGVHVQASKSGIKITVQGVKVSKTNGQPIRQLWFSAEHWMVMRLLARISLSGQNRIIVRIQDARVFCDHLRVLSHRLFPDVGYVITPYSYRHAFASDRKAERVSKEALGSMLGHASERSQRSYGIARQGREPLVRVQSVAAMRPLRRAKEPAGGFVRAPRPAQADVQPARSPSP